jgi:dTDP-4-dehydrorhamnose reductase
MPRWREKHLKILVTGANGLLGTSLCPYLRQRGYDVIRQARDLHENISVDLTDFLQVQMILSRVQPSLIVNLAALTNVDECECHPRAAYFANTHIVENLAHWIAERGTGCHLLQLSTDQVYDGVGPHKETPVCPTNYYAFSKYAGELAAISAGATILRTNFVGRSRCAGRQTFSDWLIGSFGTGVPLSLVGDVYFSPLDIAELPKLIERVIEARRPGVFNLGSRGGMSKADFAERLAEKLGLSTANACRRSVAELNLPAYRPKDMRMECSLFEETFGVELPTIEQSLAAVAQSYRIEIAE